MKNANFIFIAFLFVVTSSGMLQAQEHQNPSQEMFSKFLQEIPSINSSPFLINDVELDAFILDFMETNHIPGLAVSIIKYGEVARSKGYGFASFNPPKPVTEDTVFILASVSKPVTGTALMQLYDEGKFNLHDPVNDYLPFKVIHPNHQDTDITFHMLLTHTSGIQDNWTVMPTYPGDPPISMGQYLQDYLCEGGTKYYPNSNFYNWKPGTKFEYSNIGCALVGYLVKVISGLPSFEAYCQENIFGPLEMYETSWFVGNLDPNNMAMPYEWDGSKYIPHGHYNVCYYPASALRTSVSQLSRFLLTFMENRDPINHPNELHILNSETALLMTTLQIPQINPETGLFWFKGTAGWCHPGGFYGVNGMMWFNFEADLGIIFLWNTLNDNAFFPFFYAILGYAQGL